MRQTVQHGAGFSLIETMIAMFLIAFIVGELGLVDVGNRRLAWVAKSTTKANALADDAIEKSRNMKYEFAKLCAPIADLSETCCLGAACASDLSAWPPIPAVPANVTRCTSSAAIDTIFTRVRLVTPLDAGNTTTTLALSKKADVVATVIFYDTRPDPQDAGHRPLVHRVSVGTVISKY